MFNRNEFESINTEYNKLIKLKSDKAKIIWTPIFVVFTIVILYLIFVVGLLERGPWNWIISIYGGIIFGGLLIAVLFSHLGISEKPAFNFLYKEIYEKIILEEQTFIKYTPYEKIKPEFNKRGGLFSRFSRAAIRRHIQGVSSTGNDFDIYDIQLITGSGKDRRVHLDGIYFVIKVSNYNTFQIRSNGSPHLKGTKYSKVEDINDIKVYVEEGKMLANTDYNYIETVKRFKLRLNAKKIFMSMVHNEIHFAFVPINKIRKQKSLTNEKLNQIYSYFIDEINIIDELVSQK